MGILQRFLDDFLPDYHSLEGSAVGPKEVTTLSYGAMVRVGGEQYPRSTEMKCVHDSEKDVFEFLMDGDTEVRCSMTRANAMYLYDLLEKFIYSGDGE